VVGVHRVPGERLEQVDGRLLDELVLGELLEVVMPLA
jgi:hypothetical protein